MGTEFLDDNSLCGYVGLARHDDINILVGEFEQALFAVSKKMS